MKEVFKIVKEKKRKKTHAVVEKHELQRLVEKNVELQSMNKMTFSLK